MIRVEKHFRHPVERVFDAVLDPATVGLWLFRTPAGELTKAKFDPTAGGGFLIFEQRGDMAANHWGEFITIDRPRRVVFDFLVDEAPTEKTRVTVAFASAGDGCDVALTHDLAPKWADYADRTVHGWATILDSLESMMETAP